MHRLCDVKIDREQLQLIKLEFRNSNIQFSGEGKIVPTNSYLVGFL